MPGHVTPTQKKNSRYVRISFLPDEDKFPCCMIDNFGIISQVEWREKKTANSR
jgi:hypothetical protein